MSDERNIQAFRRIIEEGFGKGSFGVLDDLFAPGYRAHQFLSPPTLEEFKQSTGGLRAAFPDLTITIEDVIAYGQKGRPRIDIYRRIGDDEARLYEVKTGSAREKKARIYRLFNDTFFGKMKHATVAEIWVQ